MFRISPCTSSWFCSIFHPSLSFTLAFVLRPVRRPSFDAWFESSSYPCWRLTFASFPGASGPEAVTTWGVFRAPARVCLASRCNYVLFTAEYCFLMIVPLKFVAIRYSFVSPSSRFAGWAATFRRQYARNAHHVVRRYWTTLNCRLSGYSTYNGYR